MPTKSDDSERELEAFTRRLASVRPSPAGLDADRMLFEAGRAAARASGASSLRHLTTLAAVLIAVGLGVLYGREHAVRRNAERETIATRDQIRALQDQLAIAKAKSRPAFEEAEALALVAHSSSFPPSPEQGRILTPWPSSLSPDDLPPHPRASRTAGPSTSRPPLTPSSVRRLEDVLEL
jgi:hypothetical protein